MRKFLQDIDRLLRGGYTQPEQLRDGRISVPLGTLVLGGLFLGCGYGVFMGVYGVTRPGNGTVMQLLSTTLKVPLLFMLTLVVSFPSLYVMSALAGSRLKFRETLRLLLAAVAVNLAVLASLGPVVGFFTLSTQSYPFMIVLNVVFFVVSGLVGLIFLRRALSHVFAATAAPEPTPAPGDDEASPPRPPRLPAKRRDLRETVFRCWLVVYGIVGAQMGWILRPFIGSPDLPFEWFRERESHFLAGLISALGRLFS